MGDFVTEMHTKSGLLPQISASTVRLMRLNNKRWSSSNLTSASTLGALCGNSIGTDRRFSRSNMPELEAFFHYRNVDSRPSKNWLAAGILGPCGITRQRSSHRALDDIKEVHR